MRTIGGTIGRAAGVGTTTRLGAPVTRAGGLAIREGVAAAPKLATTKALQIQSATDGSAVISSDQSGGTVSFAPSADGASLIISEILSDGSTGESVTVAPAPVVAPVAETPEAAPVNATA